jgi:hypothetical protein
MSNKRDAIEEQVAEVWQDLQDLWVTLTVDPKKQARKERAWSMLSGALGAAATMGARRATTKIWDVLTGEPPPPVQKALQEAAQPNTAVGHSHATQPHQAMHEDAAVQAEDAIPHGETSPGRADA